MYWSLKRVINKLRKEFSQPMHEKADGRPAALNSSCSFLSQHFLPDCPNWCARATASFSSIGMSFEHRLSQYFNIHMRWIGSWPSSPLTATLLAVSGTCSIILIIIIIVLLCISLYTKLYCVSLYTASFLIIVIIRINFIPA